MYFLARVELTGLHDPVAAGQAVDQLLATDLTADQRAHVVALQADVQAALASGTTVAADADPTAAAPTSTVGSGTALPAAIPGTVP